MPFRRLSWTWLLLFVVLAVFQRVGATITLGVDMSATGTTDEAEAYLNKVEQKIMAVWKRPPTTDGLKVTLCFNLARNGFVSAVRVEKSSGNQSFDDSAVQAVRRASPFPRPPKSFPVGDLRMVLDPSLPAPNASPVKQQGI
jgi:TolA protein